jgi:hypothetical protein
MEESIFVEGIEVGYENPRRITWAPKQDITAFELAACLSLLLEPDWDATEKFNNLPSNAQRHFVEVEPMTQAEAIRYSDGVDILRELTTWKKFKAFVDKRLAEKGVSQDITIEYIDVSQSISDIDVYVDDKNNDMAIH